jgi:hypothetical protein
MKSHFQPRILMILGLLAALGVVAVLAQGAPPTVGPAVNPASVQKKAGTPPPANATKVKSAGGTAVKASTANAAADDDSFWTEEIDIDGDGNVEATSLIWDDEDKVLFSYSDGTFTCANGGTGTGELLIATYAAGNTGKRPAGSGFWVADLDAGECAAQAEGLWGCRFNPAGKPTACGVVTIDDKADDIVIVTAKK